MAKSTVTVRETFPQITSEASIKQVVSKMDCADVKFEGFQLSPNQYADLVRWQQNGDSVKVTIEQLQGRLD